MDSKEGVVIVVIIEVAMMVITSETEKMVSIAATMVADRTTGNQEALIINNVAHLIQIRKVDSRVLQ